MRGDLAILALVESGRLRVDYERGLVFAPKSNTPDKPVGALTKKGYLRVCVTVSGRQMHFMAHRIVWVAKHGPVPPGDHVDHRNTNKQDNRLSNLEAVPAATNMRRAKEAGLCRANGRRDGVRDDKGRFGKRAAGRLLDGRTHDGMPRPAGEGEGAP
jgi:hypothetical protein